DHLMQVGRDPADAFGDLATWVTNICGNSKPIMVAYPAVFDWAWIHWYFVRFLGYSPFGFSGGLDVKTLHVVTTRTPFSAAGRAALAARLQTKHPHTHNALEDGVRVV